MAEENNLLIDNFTAPDLMSALGTEWRGVSDRVMGGLSEASVRRTCDGGRQILHLRGEVRLENNGGFIQAALYLAPGNETLDVSGFRGVRLIVRGNSEHYSVHLRTLDSIRPWQSYRAEFTTGPDWRTIELPFANFEPHRIEAALDTRRLRRLGLVAIGRAFCADLMVSSLVFYL